MSTDIEKLYGRFLSPDASWRGKPFWSWNGELDKDELCRQVEILKEMGFGGHFMHSRSGLITEYLGDEWFSMINAVSDKSEEEGMEAWLYDEDRWPSGSAGGKATVEEKYRMRSLKLSEYSPEKFSNCTEWEFLFVGAVEDDGKTLTAYKRIPRGVSAADEIIKAGEEYGDKLKILCFTFTSDPDDSVYNGSGYLDTMNREAVEHFIDLTHERYRINCGDRMGRSISGIFTDEPHRGHGLDDLDSSDGARTCSICRTTGFFEEFLKRYGYDPVEILPELFYRYKGALISKIKIDWFDLACNLFNESFAQPINEWCDKNGILFTGHVLHEDELINQTVCNGSLMRFYMNMAVPGVDTLGCDNYNYRIVKQLSSAARQAGKKRLLSELYGCTGWNFDFTGHRDMGAWQAFFGINLRCPHLSWYTMEGEAKRDYPASILHQSPWYRDYADIETYFARFGLLSSGDALCDVLVLNPIESVWGMAYSGWTSWLFSRDGDVDALEDSYRRTFEYLTSAHIDFDYGEEYIMESLAGIRERDGKPVLYVGKAEYRTVVVSSMLTIRKTTLELLKRFRSAGGRVIFTGDIPGYVGGVPSDEARSFSSECVCVPFDKNSIAAAVKDSNSPCINSEKVFIRRFSFGEKLYCVTLLNTDRDNPVEGAEVHTGIGGRLKISEWDMMSGKKYSVNSRYNENGALIFTTRLAPGEAKAFILSGTDEETESPDKLLSVIDEYDISPTECLCERHEENVLVCDRVKYRINAGEWQDETEVLRADMAVRDYFSVERRSGNMIQPWYSRIHYPEKLGDVEMKYIFRADRLPKGDIYLAAERPEVMNYKLNGHPLTPDGTFWTDICFKRMPVPNELIKPGMNEITVSVPFSRNVNFEAVYLLGDFGAAADGCIPVMTDIKNKVTFGDLSGAGYKFYGGNLTYTLPADSFNNLRERASAPGERIYLRFEGVQGSLIKCEIDGREEKLLFRPYKADITRAVRENRDIKITLMGNRRNTFGPLHKLPADHTGSSPWNFITAGDDWSDEIALPAVGIQRVTVEIKAEK